MKFDIYNKYDNLKILNEMLFFDNYIRIAKAEYEGKKGYVVLWGEIISSDLFFTTKKEAIDEVKELENNIF